MGSSYQQGWKDCLNAVLSVLDKAKDVDETRKKIESLQVLGKGFCRNHGLSGTVAGKFVGEKN